MGIQQQIGKDIIPVLHKLEQVSSDEHIGTMAENLMEALKENHQVKARVSGTTSTVKWLIIELPSARTWELL